MESESVKDDHEILKEILKPLIAMRSKDQLRQRENRQLHDDIHYFAMLCPNAAARKRLLRKKTSELDQDTLAADHQKLQKLIFPRIAWMLDYERSVRDRSIEFQLWQSERFYKINYPTHSERAQHLQRYGENLSVNQIAFEENREKFLRAWVRMHEEGRLDIS